MSIHKIIKKSGVRYKAVVQVSPTKQACRVFGRKIDAEAWEDEQKCLQRSLPDSAAKVSMTVSELSSYWVENYASQQKAESSLIHDKGLLKNQILPDFGARVIGELSPREVEQWMNRLRLDQRLSPKSCNHCLGLLRKMLNDAVRWQFIRFNPITSVKPFRIDQQDFAFWTREEAVRFMSHAQMFEGDVFPVFAVALYTGLRKGELRGLK